MMFGNNPGTDETVKEIPAGSFGAELGVWKGDTSAKFLTRAAKLELVDSWSPEPYKESGEWESYEHYLERYQKIAGGKSPQDFQRFYDNLHSQVVARFRNDPVTICRMTTDKWFEQTPDDYVDWVYVDASHAYKQVLKDLHNCVRVVKPGGIIFGDDYSGHKPGVKAAVDSFIFQTGLQVDNFWADQYRIKLDG